MSCKGHQLGAPLQGSGLSTWWCHHSSSGSIPGPGASTRQGAASHPSINVKKRAPATQPLLCPFLETGRRKTATSEHPHAPALKPSVHLISLQVASALAPRRPRPRPHPRPTLLPGPSSEPELLWRPEGGSGRSLRAHPHLPLRVCASASPSVTEDAPGSCSLGAVLGQDTVRRWQGVLSLPVPSPGQATRRRGLADRDEVARGAGGGAARLGKAFNLPAWRRRSQVSHLSRI